jgi:hypothetical protein
MEPAVRLLTSGFQLSKFQMLDFCCIDDAYTFSATHLFSEKHRTIGFVDTHELTSLQSDIFNIFMRNCPSKNMF